MQLHPYNIAVSMVPPPPPLRPYSGARRFWLVLGGLACLALVIVALVYVEEDQRGSRAWAAVQKDLRGRGEDLDWRHFVAPPVPDERNLAMAPFFVRELHYEVNPKTRTYTFGESARRPKDLNDMPFGDDKHATIPSASYELARPADLSGFQNYYRSKAGFPHPDQPGVPAADVLLALTRYGPALDELARAAAGRPLTRFPLDWNRDEFWGMQLPHYNLEQNLVRTLCLRASASLELGRAADALRDLELGLRLCRDMRSEHLFIGSLVEITCLSLVLNDVWQGVAARRWSAGELSRLQADLQAFDVLADYADSMRMERATTIHNVDHLKRTHDAAVLTVGNPGDPGSMTRKATKALGWFVPGGWYDANSAVISRFEQDHAVATVDVRAHRVFRDRADSGADIARELHGSPRLVLARVVLPVFASVTSRFARAQTVLDQGLTACALERYFLDHQAYPARLDALVPGYLQRVPSDVIDGAPLRYRLTPDGRYRLYGVGWNGRDDGGIVRWESNRRVDYQQGDCVWQYTELQRPDAAK